MNQMMARLGLGFAASRSVWEKICSSRSSLFMRRYSSSLAEAEADAKGMISSGSEKSLYLCFCEDSQCGDRSYSNQVVRPIRLKNSGGGDDDDGSKEELREAAYRRCRRLREWSFSGHLGSQILFPCGGNGFDYTYISRVDTSTRPLKFSSSKFKGFSSPKIDPFLVELNGKLYCIDHPSGIFEVLDPEDDFGWRPLDDPPFAMRGRFFAPQGRVCASALDGGNKILAWKQGENGVYFFDVTKPENGWTETSSRLGNLLPFTANRRPPVFIHNHHLDFYLMFSYNPYIEPLLLYPFVMSNTCDSFQPIKEPIHLPEEPCSNYIPPPGGCAGEKPICYDHNVVHLGGQKFCFVLNKLFSDDPVHGRNQSTLLLITFEYDYVVKPDSKSVDIQTRCLGTSSYRYRPRHPDSTQTFHQHLTGAFVL